MLNVYRLCVTVGLIFVWPNYYSSVVAGLNLDPIGQIKLRPFCGNTVTADLVCLNISLHDSDAPNVTPDHVVKVIVQWCLIFMMDLF